ncbi:hypothetical protein E3U43_010373, partial [Larimichthys crocea]
WGQSAISCALQTSLGGETLSTVSAGAEQSRAGEPWQQGETQTQQPVTPYRNGDSTCRHTDVDRRRRHSEGFPPIGGEIQTSHQELRLHSVVGSQLSGRLYLLRPSNTASSAQLCVGAPFSPMRESSMNRRAYSEKANPCLFGLIEHISYSSPLLCPKTLL